ncbi:exopolyphosphatase [Actinomyces vulturis]|uniref:Ppx/GppA phosphatase family protein n=1 Tax=Actinomyces vulturis TaxID=1857645 RepID=UPI000835B31C|nr:exopolyphosphatase [Actinomyces vulturis]
MTRVAAIDCGTNTIRLLITDIEFNDGMLVMNDLVREGAMVRLGKDVDKTGMLDPQALQRTLDATQYFAHLCRENSAESLRFVATSATRDASNRDEFMNGVQSILGVEPEVISGEEEASLSFLGARIGASVESGKRLIVDLGGGSTELVLGEMDVDSSYSMDIGSVRITERYFQDGVTEQAEELARIDVRQHLQHAQERVDLSQACELIGLAGTITTVTAHALKLEHFDPERIDRAVLGCEQQLASCDAIVHSKSEERESMGFLAAGRRDVIAAGALIWSEVIRAVQQATAQTDHPVTHTMTSLHDILDGIALSQI